MKTSSAPPAEFASAASEEPAAGAPRTRFANHLDRAGIVWSSPCALHCAVPVVLAGAALVSGAHDAHGHAHAHGHGTQLPLQIAFVSSSVVIDTLTRSCQCAASAAASPKTEYAEALQRIEVEGASLESFAAERGISAVNAGVRVHRARAALRQELEASCGTSAAHGCPSCSCERPSKP